MNIQRILVVGHGSAGKRHLKLARGFFPDAIIKVFVKRPLVETPKFSDGILTEYIQIKEFNPNIVVIANPSSFHLDIAELFIDKNTFILIEKPISDDLFKVNSFSVKYKQHVKKIFVGYNLRFLESLNFFKESIDKKLVGKIISFRSEVGRYLPEWRPLEDYRQSVTAQKKFGGGVLLELSHEFDYLLWIFGDINWLKSSLLKQSDLLVDVEDTAHIIMSLDYIENRNLVGTLSIDFIRRDPIRLCYAIGDLGTIRLNIIDSKVDIYLPNVGWSNLYSGSPNEINESYFREWQSFINSINSSSPFEVSFEDGLKVINVIEMARKKSFVM